MMIMPINPLFDMLEQGILEGMSEEALDEELIRTVEMVWTVSEYARLVDTIRAGKKKGAKA
jgi:hypothetical protein